MNMVELCGSPERSSGRNLVRVSTSNAPDIDDDAEDYEHDELVELATEELAAYELATDELALDESATDGGSGEVSDESSDEATHRALFRELFSESPAHHGQSPNRFQDPMSINCDALSQLQQAEYERLRFASDSSPEQRSEAHLLSLFTERRGRGRSQSTQYDQSAALARFEIDDLYPLNSQSNHNGQAAPSFYTLEPDSPTEVSTLEFPQFNGSRANLPVRRPLLHQRFHSNFQGHSSSVSSSPISLSSTAKLPHNRRQFNELSRSWNDSLREQSRQNISALSSSYYSGELAGDSYSPRFDHLLPQGSAPSLWQLPGQPDRRRGQSSSRATQSTDRVLRTQLDYAGLTSSRSVFIFLQI